jgi:hypothetical protein
VILAEIIVVLLLITNFNTVFVMIIVVLTDASMILRTPIVIQNAHNATDAKHAGANKMTIFAQHILHLREVD